MPIARRCDSSIGMSIGEMHSYLMLIALLLIVLIYILAFYYEYHRAGREKVRRR